MADEEEDLPRYSRRNRALVQRYSPKGAQEGTFNVGLNCRRSIAEQVPNSSASARMQLSSRLVCCYRLCCDSRRCLSGAHLPQKRPQAGWPEGPAEDCHQAPCRTHRQQ